MRGTDQKQESIFSYISPEKRVPLDHPLRSVREMVDEVLEEMSPRFARVYARVGRPSIAPERLLRALLLQIVYSIHSERLLMEQLNCNLLFRWFVDMEMDEEVWNHAVLSKNRERLLNEKIAEGFFQRVLRIAQPYLSDEHFTVDGTLIEAWASHKSFRPKEEEPGGGEKTGEVNFHGERRSNATHRSTIDPESRLYKKTRGSEARLCYLGHGMMENRNGLLVKTRLTRAEGRAEREAALAMAKQTRGGKRRTLAADKNYDTRDFVRRLRQMRITPHMAQNTTNRSSAIDRRKTRHAGYALSQQKRNPWSRVSAG